MLRMVSPESTSSLTSATLETLPKSSISRHRRPKRTGPVAAPKAGSCHRRPRGESSRFVLVLLFSLICLAVFVLHRIIGQHASFSRTREKEACRCIIRQATRGLTKQGIGSKFQVMKPTIILSDFLQVPLGFEWSDAPSDHPYNITDWTVPNCCQDVVGGKTLSELAYDQGCALKHDVLLHLLPGICSDQLSRQEVEETLGISDCQIVFDAPGSDTSIESLNDCAASWYSSNLLPGPLKRANSTDLLVGIHFRTGDHYDGLHAFSDDNQIIGPTVKVLDSSSTLDVRSIPFNDVVRFLTNMETHGCDIKVRVYAAAVEKVVGLPFPYELIDSGNDQMDMFDFASNDVLIQGVSSFAVLGTFLTSSSKIVVTDRPHHPKFDQSFKSWVDIRHVSDKMILQCPVAHARIV
jgi:hypothetical protein